MLAKGLIKSVWQHALLFTFVSRETLTWMASPSTGSVRTVKPLQSSVAGRSCIPMWISRSRPLRKTWHVLTTTRWSLVMSEAS